MSKNLYLYYCSKNNKILLISISGKFFIYPQKDMEDLIYVYIGKL